MTKRRISKASKRRLTIFGTISLVAIVYFCFSLLFNVYTIYNLSNEKKELENLYVQLQEDAENIKIYLEKLSDSKYLANYAREHYGYTTGGEYKLELIVEDIENDVNNISKEMNKKYTILGLSILMILIFIYILLKGRRKLNKKRN